MAVFAIASSANAGGDLMLASKDASPPVSPPGAGFHHFDIDLITKNLTAEIRSIPNTYSEVDVLKLRVATDSPGWQLKLKSSNLTLKGGAKIKSDEVYVQRSEDESTPLKTPVVIVNNGMPGLTELQVPLSLITESVHLPGTYTGWLHLTAQRAGGPESRPFKIPFTVDVSLQVKHALEGNKIYFHVGNPFKGDKLDGDINGRLEADAPMALHISSNDGRIDQMSLQKAFGSAGRITKTPWIPISWSFAERDSALRGPDEMKKDGSDISWLVNGTPGLVNYKIKCRLNPSSYQAPGDYGLTATVTLVPLL